MEIIREDGLRLGKNAGFTFDQSRYWVESALAQNSRTASSPSSIGIFFSFFTKEPPFFLARLANRLLFELATPGLCPILRRPKFGCISLIIQPLRDFVCERSYQVLFKYLFDEVGLGLNEFNTSTLDDVGRVAGGDQELKVLIEVNDLQDF